MLNQDSAGKRKNHSSCNKIQSHHKHQTYQHHLTHINSNVKSPQFQMKKIEIKQKTSPTSSQSSSSLYCQAKNKKYHLQDQIKQATEKQQDSNTYRFSRNYYSGKKSSRNEHHHRGNASNKNLSNQANSNMKSSVYFAKTAKQNFKIKVYQPLSPRSSSSSTGVGVKHKVPLLKLNTQSNLIQFCQNKGSIPDDQQAFLIKSSRESQAKQPYTATYNQSSRPDSVSHKNSSSIVRTLKSNNSCQFDLEAKSQSQIYSPKNLNTRGKSTTNETISKNSNKNLSLKKKTVSFQFNQEEQGVGIPVASYSINQKQRYTQCLQKINKHCHSNYASKQEPQTSALSEMHKYYQKQLEDKDKQIQKHKNFIIQLKGSIQSLLIEHSKCKNDLQRTKTQLTELRKIHQDSFKRPGQSLRQSKEKQDFDYFQIFDKRKSTRLNSNKSFTNNISGEARSLDLQINHKSFSNMITSNNEKLRCEYDPDCYNDDMKQQPSSRSRSSEINKLAKYSQEVNQSSNYSSHSTQSNKNRPNSAFSVNHIQRYSNKLTELSKQSKQKQRAQFQGQKKQKQQQPIVRKKNQQNF